jgi:REP element-mobilizing transposase RayT
MFYPSLKINFMKPGNFTQMYVHLIFAVKNREASLNKDIREKVFEYISGIITGMNHKSIIVNGVADHVHILIGLNPSISVSNTVQDIKRNSSLFINKEKLCKSKFAWQEGFGAFTYSRSQLDKVYRYIHRQEQHHEKTDFKDEYLQFLKKFDIQYNERWLFQFWELV